MRLEPQLIASSLETAANAHDIAAVFSLFTADPVVRFSPPLAPGENGVYHGKREAGHFLQRLVDGFHMESSNYYVAGDLVLWQARFTSDSLRQLGIDIATATIEMTLDGERIRDLNFILSPISAQEVQEATARIRR